MKTSMKRAEAALKKARDFLTAADPIVHVDALAVDDAHVPLEIGAAKAVFARLQELEAAYDPALADLYADDAVVIERLVQAGVERRTREIPARKYRALLPKALEASAKAKLSSRHEAVEARRIAPGWVLFRSLRSSTHARPAPYELLVRREPSGEWRIAKETATLAL